MRKTGPRKRRRGRVPKKDAVRNTGDAAARDEIRVEASDDEAGNDENRDSCHAEAPQPIADGSQAQSGHSEALDLPSLEMAGCLDRGQETGEPVEDDFAMPQTPLPACSPAHLHGIGTASEGILMLDDGIWNGGPLNGIWNLHTPGIWDRFVLGGGSEDQQNDTHEQALVSDNAADRGHGPNYTLDHRPMSKVPRALASGAMDLQEAKELRNLFRNARSEVKKIGDPWGNAFSPTISVA